MQASRQCGLLYLLAWPGNLLVYNPILSVTSLDSSSVHNWFIIETWLTAVNVNALLGVLVLTFLPDQWPEPRGLWLKLCFSINITFTSLKTSCACQDSFLRAPTYLLLTCLSLDLPYGPRHNLKGPRPHNLGSKFVQGRSSNENLAPSFMAHTRYNPQLITFHFTTDIRS